jgi:hypothetical protein
VVRPNSVSSHFANLSLDGVVIALTAWCRPETNRK